MFRLSPRLLHPIGQLTRRKAALAFEQAARAPEATQQDYLLSLLQRAADTEYGRAHGFGEIRSPEAFAERVPLMDGDTLNAYSKRMMQGERRILTPEDPVFYGTTTGTSGTAKYVPITPAYRRDFQRNVAISIWHLCRRFPEAFTSQFLYFVGRRRMQIAPDGLEAGAISGFNFTEMGPIAKALYAWPYELFEIDDPAPRGYLSALLAIHGDISFITGIFPLGIVSLLRTVEGNLDRLAHDLDKGTIEGATGLSAEQQAFFARLVRPRPDLARRVRAAAKAPPEAMTATIWPKLKLTFCWVSSSAGLYLPELKRRLGPTIPVRDAIYSSTEAWCNVALGDVEPGGPIAIQSVYCEFIEEQAYLAGSRQTIPAHALKDGGRYVIVVTSTSGACRYVIGDVVEVCGFYHATPRIRFLRKLGTTCNLAGELFDESHANLSVGAAMAATGLEATWFCLAGDASGDVPGYILYIEPAPDHRNVRDEDLEALARRVDEELCRLAPTSYLERRNRGGMLPVRVKRVAQGSYAAWKDRRMSEGTGEAQLKTIHLVADPSEVPPEFRS